MEKLSNEKITRRNAIAILGVGVVALVAGKSVLDHTEKIDLDNLKRATDFDKPESLAGPETFGDVEHLVTESDSGSFKKATVEYKELLKPDMPVILEEIEIIAELQANFLLPNIPQPLRGELESKIIGIAVTESRLDVDAFNESSKAFSCLQLMPETWAEHSRDGELPESVADVAKVAARLVEQEYLHITTTCKPEIELITREYFGGDSQLFMTQFLAPILINAYNAGMGTLARLIIWFAAEFPTRKESSRIGEESDVCSGYDVFLFLSQEAKSQGIIEWYKEDSMTYTPKVYGHQDAVDENFNK